jgi:ABC-type branched-subunit amino acid transport system ATPase component
MPRITRLKIHRLANVAAGTELRFGEAGVVLLGKNGTGKTTLLNLLVDLVRADFSKLSESDAFVEFTILCTRLIKIDVIARSIGNEGVGPASNEPELRALLEHPQRELSVKINVLDMTNKQQIRIESTNAGTVCKLPNGDQMHSPVSASSGWRILMPVAMDEQGRAPKQLWHAYSELTDFSRNLRRFDEGLDYFRAITEKGVDSLQIEGVRFKKKSNIYMLLDSPDSRLISAKVAHSLLGALSRSQHEVAPMCDANEVEYLRTFCTLTGFDNVYVQADLDEIRAVGQDAEIARMSPLRFSIRRNGTTIHHRHLSFGQQRLLAFLHYFDSTGSLLMADELVNGMHHEWISKCLTMLHNSQTFLSSQNPLLFDFLSFSSVDDVADRFINCRVNSKHEFAWSNMDMSDAFEFHETHKIGLQHASEILRTRGYW